MTRFTWNGQLRIAGEAAWWSGSVGDVAAHRHFAAQVVFAKGPPLRVIDEDGREISGTCLLIEPNVQHLLMPANEAEICYVEPTAVFGLPDGLHARIAEHAARLVSGSSSRPFWSDCIEGRTRSPIDTRVSSAIAEIERLLPHGTVRLSDICATGDLSAGRLRHLFAAQVGFPLQRFILWRRLAAVFESLLTGATITEAAHAAGFSDAAHFARTIKAMFGIRASDIFLER